MNSKVMQNILTGIVVLIVIAIVIFALTAQPSVAPESQNTYSENTMNNDQESLDITTLREGTGEAAVAGDTVSVHYVGTLEDGTQFDSSRKSGRPFSFLLGSGEVIQGWDQGVAGMKVGELRKLVIPSDLGYGSRGSGPILPNSTLIFEVELLSIQ